MLAVHCNILLKTTLFSKFRSKIYPLERLNLELVSKELNHFGVIADLFRQIGGHSSRFMLFCFFRRLFTKKIIKSVKVFPFSFWKITLFFSSYLQIKLPALCCKMAAKWFNSLDTNFTCYTMVSIHQFNLIFSGVWNLNFLTRLMSCKRTSVWRGSTIGWLTFIWQL